MTKSEVTYCKQIVATSAVLAALILGAFFVVAVVIEGGRPTTYYRDSDGPWIP